MRSRTGRLTAIRTRSCRIWAMPDDEACRRLTRSSASLITALQYPGEYVSDPVQGARRDGEGDPQVPVVASVDRVRGGWFQQHAESRAFLHHLMGGAGVEVKPQGDSAGPVSYTHLTLPTKA